MTLTFYGRYFNENVYTDATLELYATLRHTMVLAAASSHFADIFKVGVLSMH